MTKNVQEKPKQGKGVIIGVCGCLLLIFGCCIATSICAFLNPESFEDKTGFRFDSTGSDEEDPFDNFSDD
ncbi:MAG: hypothetical protein ABIE03_00950 [Patescibacteria group bacterium]|nr:hypothetical protein [Patescibacteria group bacterium]